MEHPEKNPEIQEQIRKLQKKYAAMGQDLSSYLDGLLYADYLTYWDYIHLDTLLSLQNPKTSFPDEQIFIIYHQITELYFRLILHELEQVAKVQAGEADVFLMRLKRVNRYLQHLEDSFDVMIQGMEQEQFLKFRMSLLPASGFQSAQYRLIEIACTDMLNLVAHDKKEQFGDQDEVRALYEEIYWKYGATELATGQKTLTLKQFEDKYKDRFIAQGEQFKACNMRQLYLKYFKGKAEQEEKIIAELRKLDALANIFWRLAHYKSAVRYLQKDPEDIKATGGTNWQKYLPPRFQQVIFFPELWTAEEKQDWGKQWVMKEVLNQ